MTSARQDLDRPGRNRRRCEDLRLEEAARRAGRRLAAGEAARDLGHAGRPAPLSHPAGSGEALPPALRARLEAGFGADLTRLRIHRGPSAAAAAAAENARAFAAGSALVFGAGAWAPGTTAGLRLIAHETAHALQQSGRPGPGGRLRLVAAVPEVRAPVQRAPLPSRPRQDPPRLQDIRKGQEFWESLTFIYKTIKPFDAANTYVADESYEREVDLIEAAAGGRLTLFTPTAASGRLATWSRSKGKALAKFRAKCLLFDTLKASGEDDAALALLIADPRLETTFYPSDWFKKVEKGFDLETRARRFVDQTESKYVSRAWKGALERLLTLATVPGTPLPAVSPVQAEVDRLLTLNFGGDTLLLNYAQALAMRDIAAVETFVLQRLAETMDGTGVKKTGDFDPRGIPLTSPYLRMRVFAETLRDVTTGEPDGAPTGLVKRLRDTLGPDAVNAFAIADRGLVFAGRLADATQTGHDLTGIADLVTGEALVLQGSPEALAFLNGLAKLADHTRADGVFALKPEDEAAGTGQQNVDDEGAILAPLAFRERMLSPADFNKRAGVFAEATRALAATLGVAFRGREVTKVPEARTKPDVRTSMLILLFWAEWFVAWAGSLRADETASDPDLVALNRYRLGQALNNLGTIAGHKGLIAEAGRVAFGSETMFSYAILPAPGFVEDTSVPMKRLIDEGEDIRLWGEYVSAKGAPPVEGHGKIAVNTAILVDFYELTYLEALLPALNAEIDTQAALVKANLELPPEKEKPLPPANTVKKLVEDVRENTPHPRYWKVADGRLVHNAKDAASANNALERHPAVRALLGQSATNPPDWSKSPIWKGQSPFRNPDNWNSVHTWTLPPMGPLVARLQTIEPVQKIQNLWKDEGIAAPAHPIDWLLQLYAWMQKRGDVESIRAAVAGKFSNDLKDRNAELRLAERKLSTLNRRLTLDYIRDRLGTLSNRDIAFDGSLVDHVTRAIQTFAAGVGPADERDLQMVALMIEAAPEFERVIAHRTGYGHIQAFFNPVALALSMATGSVVFGMSVTDDKKVFDDDPVKRDQRPAGTIAPEFPKRMTALDIEETTVTSGVATLRGILDKLDAARREAQGMFVLHASRSDGLHTSLSTWEIKPGAEDATFIMALPYRIDVYEGEGAWEPPDNRESPLEKAQAAAEESEGKSQADEPKKKAFWEYNGIVYTDYPILYRIDEIYQDFEYTPAFRSGVGQAADRAAILKRKGGGSFAKGTPLMKFSFSRQYVDEEENLRFAPERTVTVRAGDNGLLELMTSVIDNHSRMTQLRNLAEAIEWGAEAFLDLLEFVPGVGQVVMIARLGVNILQLLTDPSIDWDKIKEEVMNEPARIVALVQGDILDNLTSERIWLFLLGAVLDPSPEVARIHQAVDRWMQKRASKPAAGTDTGGALGGQKSNYRRFIAAIGRIGKRFAGALDAAMVKMQVGVNAAQGNVAANPVLFKHLSRIDQYLAWAMALHTIADALKARLDPDAGAAAETLQQKRDEEQGDFKDAGDDLGGAIRSMVAPVQQLELPGEVFPLDLAVQMVLEFIFSRIKNKKVRAVYEALRITGGLSLISSKIAEKLLAGTEADPNTHWRNLVLPKIQGPFVEGRDELVAAIYEAVNHVVPSANVTAPTLPAAEITEAPFTMDDPEATLQDFEGFGLAADPRRAPPLAPPEDPGAPLPEATRTELQGSFGHDLSHVRLHRGREADAFVQDTGAEALTSGSDIWLRDRAAPGTGAGDHVLRHEVAHVLQQTGGRPLGRDRGAAPLPGSGGRGLMLDPVREAAAEHMAVRSRRHHATDDGPMPIEGPGGEGLAPFSREDMVKLLHKLTRNAHPREFAETLEREPKLTKGGKRAEDAALALYADLLSKLRSGSVKHAATMTYGTKGSVVTEINTYLHDRLKLPTDSDIPLRIASRAITKLPEKQRTKTNIYQLDPQAFLNVMEGFVFSRTGIRLTLNEQVGNDHVIGNANIRSVHLGGIVENTGLYTHIKTLYEGHPYPKLEFPVIRAYLRARFPLPHKWARNIDLVMDQGDLKDIFEATHKPSAVSPEDLPPWKVYADPKTRPVTSGIRVANHGDLTGTGAAPGRESHHLPQFLLVEFYTGEATVSPFDHDGSYWVPGFTRGGSGTVTRKNRSTAPYSGFKSPSLDLDFDAFGVGSNRGSGMPAVSLMAATHQKGGLHLHQERHWNDPTDVKKQPAQGYTMINRHRDYLIAEVRKANALGGNAAGWEGSLATGAGFASHVDAVMATADEDKIGKLKDAGARTLQRSYKMFVQVMEAPLRRALREIEAPEYVGLAAQRPDYADNPANPYYGPGSDTGWIDTVMDTLKSQNRTAYGENKWFDSGAWN